MKVPTWKNESANLESESKSASLESESANLEIESVPICNFTLFVSLHYLGR